MTIYYQCGYKYRLYKDAVFVLPKEFHQYQYSNPFLTLKRGGELTIREGYCWDGASGPTADTKSSMQGSLWHDALYQLIREGALPRILKPAADLLLKETCIEDGMFRLRAWYWHKAVQKLGMSATIRNKDIMVAP